MKITIKEFYKSNADFKRYVDTYCICYDVDVPTALTHALVIEAMKYYMEE